MVTLFTVILSIWFWMKQTQCLIKALDQTYRSSLLH
uniref:Uncharacterized protein n=1 Tax=Arundo donax TaxID=35708 RepID=A0A0A9E6P0_ARUDO